MSENELEQILNDIKTRKPSNGRDNTGKFIDEGLNEDLDIDIDIPKAENKFNNFDTIFDNRR